MKKKTAHLNPVFLLLGLLCSAVFAADESLPQLVEAQEFESALELINTGVNVNMPSVDGTTALHWASYYGAKDLVRRLIRAEADPNTQNDYGSSPLGEAAIKGNTELLQILLDAGADVESPNPEGQTALMAVARTGNIDAARLLLSHGANINAVESWAGQSALMWAAARQHPHMVEFLIDNGADIEQRSIDRDWERRITSEPRVKVLEFGGLTALLFAVREGCLECAQALVEAGADINKPNPNNISPLIMAIINLRFDIAHYLIEAGADINQWDYYGRTPLFASVDQNLILGRSRRGDLPAVQEHTAVDIARLLLERGANPDLSLKLHLRERYFLDRFVDFQYVMTGSTPLQHAAFKGDRDMIALLLQHGARLDLANVNGVTPMIAMAAQPWKTSAETRSAGKSDDDILAGFRLLLDAGGDINQTGGYFEETPLHIAARGNFPQATAYLIEQGADLYAQDNRGMIPADNLTGLADQVNTFEDYDQSDALAVLNAFMTTGRQ